MGAGKFLIRVLEMSFDQLVCVTGLPRAGSTLLCQLLKHHPDIYCDGHTSPLLSVLTGLRKHISESDFMMAQMDVDYETTYERIAGMNRGLIDGWFKNSNERIKVDKNRAWLKHYHLIQSIKPETKMLVCVRNPEQIYGSIENRHKATMLLDFPDKLADLSEYDRADKLFASGGVIGNPLNDIAALQDFHPDTQTNIYFVIFEQLMNQPVQVMTDIFKWLNAADYTIDKNNLATQAHESDSYYKFKYSHKTRSQISPPSDHVIPTRIKTEIRQSYSWFYQNFYPDVV